jgi:hypothetical protein
LRNDTLDSDSGSSIFCGKDNTKCALTNHFYRVTKVQLFWIDVPYFVALPSSVPKVAVDDYETNQSPDGCHDAKKCTKGCTLSSNLDTAI